MQAMDNLGVSDANLEARERSARLKQAIQTAGGQAAVARKSGIALGTLKRVLAGNETTVGTMAALANACGASMDWIVTGEGPRTREVLVPAYQPGASLFQTLDMDRLARAIEKSLRAFASEDKVAPPRALGQVIALFYDLDEMPDGEQDQMMAWVTKPVKSPVERD